MVVTTLADEAEPELGRICAASGWRLLSVPPGFYATNPLGAAELSPVSGPGGGHILLTSGTTGITKKILVDSAQQDARSAFLHDLWGVTDQSVLNVLNFGGWTAVGYNYSPSVWEAGGTVVIYETRNLHEALGRQGTTHTYTTPQMLTEILSAQNGAVRYDEKMSLFIVAGPLSQRLWEQAKQRLTPLIYTHYGSTEASNLAMTLIETPEDLRWHRVIPVRQVQVVDEQGRMLPAGQVGLVRSLPFPGLAGYLGDRKASEAFFRDGYFYPGDLGVFRSDGRLAIQGRVTDVINVLGDKRPATPIEAALEAELEVSAVCILSVQNATAEEELHVVIESPQTIDPARVSAAIVRALPNVGAVHAHIREAMPRNDMGKIRRDVLRKQMAPTAGK